MFYPSFKQVLTKWIYQELGFNKFLAKEHLNDILAPRAARCARGTRQKRCALS